MPIQALAGLVCGLVIGFQVPHAFRENLRTPYDPVASGRLDDFLAKAKEQLGDPAGRSWVFGPNPRLGGITPAEAVQCEGWTASLSDLLKERANLQPQVAKSPAVSLRAVA